MQVKIFQNLKTLLVSIITNKRYLHVLSSEDEKADVSPHCYCAASNRELG